MLQGKSPDGMAGARGLDDILPRRDAETPSIHSRTTTVHADSTHLLRRSIGA